MSGFDAILAVFTTVKSIHLWHKPGMKYILAGLIGSILYDIVILALAINSLSRVSVSNTISVVLILFTIGNIVKITPTTAFSAYMLGLLDRSR
jgi:hypothetical protein